MSFPEEDGVEHRAEPPVLGYGDDLAPRPGQGNDAGPPAWAGDDFTGMTSAYGMPANGEPDGMGSSMPMPPSFVAGAVPVPPRTDGNRDRYSPPPAGPPPTAMRMPAPYPPVAPPPFAPPPVAPTPRSRRGTTSPMARITASFAALTRAGTRSAPPVRSAPPTGYRAQRSRQQQPRQGRPPQRKAQLVLSRIEPWSVMKFSFMISLVGWVVLFVAVAFMYFVLSKLGVFASIERTVGLVTSTKSSSGTNAASWFAASRVLGYTMLAGAINVVLITALATVGAVIYNLITHLAGGIEVTLRETD